MIGLLQNPGAVDRLRSFAGSRYLENDDATAYRVACWFAVATAYTDAALELIEKTAFRGRRAGLLAAERRRLSAKRLAPSGAFSSDPAVDRRMRQLQERLARLDELSETLEQPVPREGPALDNLLLRLCGPNGWYHNMPLPDGRGTLDIGHYKQNSPIRSRDHNSFQLGLLRPHLPGFEGLTVADLGPADGYFGLTAAREGAQVMMIEPDPLNCIRIRFFAKLYGLSGTVQLANTYLGVRHAGLLQRCDVCIASGLLYHLWPLRGSLDLLLETRGLLVLEYEFEDRDLCDPLEAESGWQPSTPIPDRWLQRHLAERDWTALAFPEWEAKMARERPDGARRKMILCRRAAKPG